MLFKPQHNDISSQNCFVVGYLYAKIISHLWWKKLCTLHVKQFGLDSKFAVILAVGKSIEAVHGTLRLQVTDSKNTGLSDW